MVISFGDLRRGVTIELDGEPYQVVEYSHHKMQQRAPVIRLRLRELRTGRSMDRTFNGYDVKLTLAAVEQRTAQYIYQDADQYYFMDRDLRPVPHQRGDAWRQPPLPEGANGGGGDVLPR